MSTLITFDPNQAADWLADKRWADSREGILHAEMRWLVDTASAEGVFGDVTVELRSQITDQSVVIVTVKNPAAVTRVVSPTFNAGVLAPMGLPDNEAALAVLTTVAEMAADALAPLTTYVVSWSGGYETPSFHQHATLAAAKAQIAGWVNENSITDGEVDEIHILAIVAGSPTVDVIAYGARNANNEYVMVATDGQAVG